MKNKLVVLILAFMLLTGIFLGAIPIINADMLEVGPGKPYSTIQAAIDAASPSDTVYVHPGTYKEGLTVNKPLTLTGSGAATTIIDGNGTIMYSIRINSAPVVVEGFRFQNIKPEMDAIYIWVHATSKETTIRNNQFIGVYDPEIADHGVYVENTLTGGKCIIQGNDFERMWQGVLLELAQGSASIVDNRFHDLIYGNDAGEPYWGAEGIYATTYNGKDISELLTIDGNEFYDYRGIAIAITGPYPDEAAAKWTRVEIKNNMIETIGSGFEPWPYGITLTNGLTSGDSSQGGVNNLIISNNTMTGDGASDSIGIRMLGRSNNVTITENSISQAGIGILATKRATAPDTPDWYPSNLKVHYNNIPQSTTYGINNLSPSIVDARFNWWGNANGPTHSSNPNGTGGPITDNIDYSPWLGAAFETTPRTYHVNPTGTIQEAIDEASPGDTITVLSGIYYENQILIEKPLNVLGADADTTIIDGSLASLVSGGLVRITASTGNVVFSGFTLRNPGATASGDRFGIYASSTLEDPTYTISYNKILGTNADDPGDYGLYSNSGKEKLVFTHNLMTQHGSNPILFEKHVGETDASYNTLDEGFYGSVVYFSMTYGGTDITTLQRVSHNTINLGTGFHAGSDYYGGGIVFRSAYSGSLGLGKYTNVQITDNVINSVKGYRRAISLSNDAPGDGTGAEIVSTTITGNIITGVPGETDNIGVQLRGLVINANVSNNQIGSIDKSFYGARGVYGDHYPTGTTIKWNNFNDNLNGFLWTGTADINARYNWWGDPTGPYHPELNPSGEGDKISNYVDFEPWLLEPCPPATPVETLLYIDPAKVEYWTPSYDRPFEVDLKIANVINLTCYEFKLYWNTTLLDFNYAFIVEIWPLQITIENINESMGRYWLAISALGEENFTGSATLVELYFKIKYDPIYPNNVYSLLNLNETWLYDTSEPFPQPIPHMVHDGEYWLYSTKPKMKVEPPISAAKKLGKVFDVNITVQDVVDLYDFEFWLYYNTTLLHIYSPSVQLGSLMSGATIYIFDVDYILGYVHFAAKLAAPALPVSGSGTIAIVTFEVTKTSVWPDPDLECTLDLLSTKIKTNGEIEVPHDDIDGLYRYTPLEGDLNSDGTVDLDDIYIISAAFGSKPGDSNWNRIADLDRSNLVNVGDLRTAARHYGEDC